MNDEPLDLLPIQGVDLAVRGFSGAKMTTIEDTLTERGGRYGDFTLHAKLVQKLLHDLRSEPGWGRLNDVQAQAMTAIMDKVARIVNGDPDYADNWHDIQGYARLVEDRLPRRDQALGRPRSGRPEEHATTDGLGGYGRGL